MNVHSLLRLSFFEFSSLNVAVSVCPKVPIRFIQVDGHRETQISAPFSSFQLNLAHFALISRFLVTLAVSFTSLDPA